MARDPDAVMDCRKCKAAGIEPPFSGTFAELGRHHQTAHKRAAVSSPAAGDAHRPSPTGPAAGDGTPDDVLPGDALGADNAGSYERTDERVPGGVTITGAADAEPPRKRTWRERIWNSEPGPGRSAGEAISAPLSRKERTPTRGRRSSTAPLFELAWKWLGTRLERTEADIVVGRCLVYQSPVAGDTLEKLTQGTFIDRMLQPLAARADELETAASLFMLPVMIGMLERNPHMANVLLPMISDAIEVHLHAMVPIIKKQRADRAKLAEATKELYPDAPEGADPIAMVMAEMFTGTIYQDGFTPDAIATAQRMAAEQAAATNGAAA